MINNDGAHGLNTNMKQRLGLCLFLATATAVGVFAAEEKSPAAKEGAPKAPYVETYQKYKPDFVDMIFKAGHKSGVRSYHVSKDMMKLSSEKKFFSLCLVNESPRAVALVKAAMDKEQQGMYREALEIYQKVIDKFPGMLYRVSEYGVFVPVSHYCQLRILQFPKEHLQYYRMKHDARAKEAFEFARRKNSLEGLARIRDEMLCTSYGADAMLALGDMALDQGHYLEALEYFKTVQENFPDKRVQTPELVLKTEFCRKMMGRKEGKDKASEGKSRLQGKQLESFRRYVKEAKVEKPEFYSHLVSAPYVSADDHTLFPPSTDPLGLNEPVWETPLPGSRTAVTVFTQPTVTSRSLIYRHKNIVYSRSILSGELDWVNDMGGRVNWQNYHQRQYPHERILVQDGLVFTPMYKVGPSLMALDEVTGQLKWAYGPVVASNEEESNMRFETAPAGGPRTVYAGYILDNIAGETHTDSEYGVMAFESATGRIKWRKSLCRLPPGKFTGGFANKHRNRIRSFSSPPLYHQGTVYYCTNAGVVAALDALSGQVKWLIRYPYVPNLHDATRQYGGLPGWSGTVATAAMHEPAFWFNQRPVLVGERLFILPVNSVMMHCLDRQTGRVIWSKKKGGSNFTYMLGPTREGHMVFTYSGRGGIIQLVDPKTGQTVWSSPDPIHRDPRPCLNYHEIVPGEFNKRAFYLMARPFLTREDRLYTSYFIDYGYPAPATCASMAELSLKDRKILNKRYYFTPTFQVFAAKGLTIAKGLADNLAKLPHLDARAKQQLKITRAVAADTVPENEHKAFVPFSRVTFKRFGVTFELRIEPRGMAMVYDRDAVKKTVAAQTGADALFAHAELALSEARDADAAKAFKQCLAMVSSEDLDFRARVNQQLHQAYKRLAQSAVRSVQNKAELENCVGMSKTVNTLPQEMQTLMAMSEAYERQGDYQKAVRIVQRFVKTYGHYEYPIPSLLAGDVGAQTKASHSVLDGIETFVKANTYGQELVRPAKLSRKMLGLYFSALSPLKRDSRVRAGELGAGRLMHLQTLASELAKEMETRAEEALSNASVEEQLLRLWEFPGTKVAQQVVDKALKATEAKLKIPELTMVETAALRKREWALADAARICRLKLPPHLAARLLAPSGEPKVPSISGPMTDREESLEDARAPAWLVLERRGDLETKPDLMFLAARVKKRMDHKFLLYCKEMSSGKLLWKAQEQRGEKWFEEIRLRDKADEPGFFEAFVHGDEVVVHGLYDVLAFGLEDGKLRWHYRAPFNFEIRHVVKSGDLLFLAGEAQSVALRLGTKDPRGELVWEENEVGSPYIAPYLHGDRLVEVRKVPSNLTVRYRSTGKLMGRLVLPDLQAHDEHPLLDKGPRAKPIAHDGKLLVVTDGWYYVMVDVEKMKVIWKRLIDANDVTRAPPMRFEMNGDYLSVLKQDYDVKAIYMLSSQTGNVLWRTDPKVANSPQPMHSMLIRGGKLFGIRPHPGQGFYFVGLDCKTGKPLFRQTEQKGYGGKPEVSLRKQIYGTSVVALLKDRQDFEVKAFDVSNGKPLHTVKLKSSGNLGQHGFASATAQNGKLVLFGGNKLKIALKK